MLLSIDINYFPQTLQLQTIGSFQAAKYSIACSQITDEEHTRNRTMPLAQKCIKCGHVVTWNSDLLDKCPACNDRMWSLTPGNVDPDQRLRHWLGDVYDRPTVGARGSNYYNHGSAYFARRPATAGAGWFNAPHPDHRFGASYSTAAVRESAPLAGRLFARESGD
jgi:predicted  nucleic acid-binding Zn-ribbon protein